MNSKTDVGAAAASLPASMMLSALMALCAAIALAMAPMQAWAYFSKPAPSISVPASVSLYSGDTQQVTCAVDPLSERQLPGCGMAECPQACDGLENPQTGVVGGCLNADGWCTCAGTMYSTVQTSVSVSSSNPSVARASWSGGVLSISGYRAGTVTLSINASLAKHESAAAQVSVEVVAPPSNAGAAQSQSDAAGDAAVNAGAQNETGTNAVESTATAAAAGASEAVSGNSGQAGAAATTSSAKSAASKSGAGGASTAAGGSAKGGGSSVVGSAAVSATVAGQSANPAVSVGSDDGSQQGESADVVRIDSREGEQVILARAGMEGSASLLKEIAASDGRVTFWSGGTSDSPDVSVTYYGKDLQAGAVADGFDSSVRASKKGSDAMAELLAGAERSIVIEFGATGALPAKAQVYVRTSAVFDEGAALGLYEVSEDGSALKLIKDGIAPKDAYASFEVEAAKAYALVPEGFAGVAAISDAERAKDGTDGSPAAPTADEKSENAGQIDATTVDVHAKSGAPYLAVAGVLCAAAVAGAAMYAFMRRRARLALDAAMSPEAAGDEAEGE